jgi:hypothetical protein
MAGRYSLDRARIYEALEDALAALDVARDAVHGALAAADYPHLRENEVTESKKAALAPTGAA